MAYRNNSSIVRCLTVPVAVLMLMVMCTIDLLGVAMLMSGYITMLMLVLIVEISIHVGGE